MSPLEGLLLAERTTCSCCESNCFNWNRQTQLNIMFESSCCQRFTSTHREHECPLHAPSLKLGLRHSSSQFVWIGWFFGSDLVFTLLHPKTSSDQCPVQVSAVSLSVWGKPFRFILSYSQKREWNSSFGAKQKDACIKLITIINDHLKTTETIIKNYS